MLFFYYNMQATKSNFTDALVKGVWEVIIAQGPRLLWPKPCCVNCRGFLHTYGRECIREGKFYVDGGGGKGNRMEVKHGWIWELEEFVCCRFIFIVMWIFCFASCCLREK